jgi:phage terminase large subunit-like protein
MTPKPLYGTRYLGAIDEVLWKIKAAREKSKQTIPPQNFEQYNWVEIGRFVRDELHLLDLDETLEFYAGTARDMPNLGKAFLACNDRFYLLTQLLGRDDLIHPWLFDRCREVEDKPYGHIDLWFRGAGKSSIITTGGIIQEIIREPEVTVAIFSVTKPLAQEFLGQIKNEFETNEDLKSIFPDILYENPRGKAENGERPAKWSLARGITVRRKGHPKEATVEAHGLIDGQPTGRHFRKHYYDDIVTQDYLSEEQIKKTTARFEMADNLGTRHGVDKCIAGTRYHFADTYGVILERGSAKPRIYPATVDGTLHGQLVLLTPENWERIKREQGMKTTASQMLLNPTAANEATFSPLWLRQYEVVPRVLNVYILVDPSKGTGERSDRTAIVVMGLDPAGNWYLLDGVCHRMRLTERLALVTNFKARWDRMPGVQTVKVGWERYGKDVELEAIEALWKNDPHAYRFTIHELNTPRSGGHSKADRIERLEPDIRGGRFYLPAVVHHQDFGPRIGEFAGCAFWSVWTQEDAKRAAAAKMTVPYHIGQIIYRPMKGLTRLMREYSGQQNSRIVTPLKRRDENKDVYDLTRVFMEEMIRHPFAAHDDLIDATSRIYDIEPLPPAAYEAPQSTESIEGEGPLGVDTEAVDDDYDVTSDWAANRAGGLGNKF